MSHCVVDLTLSSDDECAHSRPVKRPLRSLHNKSYPDDPSSDIEIVATPSPRKRIRIDNTEQQSGSKSTRVKGKRRAIDTPRGYESDDEILIKDGSRYISSNAYTQAIEDERLAKKLAAEEEQQYQQLLKEVKSREEGIVFRLSINAEDNTLDDGSPAHIDDIERFQPWKEICDRFSFKIKRFHWIVNHELEKRFDRAVRHLEYITGKKWPEKMLFHGTASQNIDLILKGGFRIGGVDGHPMSHGSASGRGVYLATNPAVSMGYCTPEQDTTTNRIFCCRVVPGRTTKSLQYSNKVPPSTELGHENYECYNPGPNDVHVVRYTSLILPCYMIEFERTNVFPGLPVMPWAGLGMAPFGGIPVPPPVLPPAVPYAANMARLMRTFAVGGQPGGMPVAAGINANEEYDEDN
ncbi:hypothetical protein DL96DRAFT_1613584 [Flagelloscypha sp. PMI_526]|nr:hypothetical protein DL96DRAFT_1613584 [Flagelloscypha sp. PMI_526]